MEEGGLGEAGGGAPDPGGKAMGQEEDSILEMAKVTPQAHKHSATPPSSQGRRHGRQQGTQVGPAGRALRKEGEA